MISYPLVTCLCLTRNRREFLPRAIASFQQQTYERKELLIVDDGEDVSDLVPRDAQIRYLRLPVNRIDLVVGVKRNIGCAHAFGDVVAHWDDDDYSAPERLTEQVAHLLEYGRAVTGYHSLTFHELRSIRVMGEDGGWRAPASPYWLFREQHGLAAGTSLCYRRSWWAMHRFQPVRSGEDDLFYAKALDLGAAAAVDGIERICATNHAGSVSGRLIGGVEWEELPGRPEWLSRA